MTIVCIVQMSVVILCGLVVLAAAYTYYAARQIEREHPPTGQYVCAKGVRLHYVDAGSGPCIVLLHGVSASLRDFSASILHDLAQDHRVIAFDRPGYGYSDRPAGHWPDPAFQAELIRDALNQLGIHRPLLVGHSWGGSLVLTYLLKFPNESAGAVLLAGAVNSWDTGVGWFYNLAARPVIGWLFTRTAMVPLGQVLLNSVIANVFAPDEPTDDYRRRTGSDLALRPQTVQASAEDVSKLSSFLQQQSQHYDKISEPLLLVTGSDDTIVPALNHAENLAARLPRAELVELQGVGHAFHHSRAAEVIRLIRLFARKIEGRGLD